MMRRSKTRSPQNAKKYSCGCWATERAEFFNLDSRSSNVSAPSKLLSCGFKSIVIFFDRASRKISIAVATSHAGLSFVSFTISVASLPASSLDFARKRMKYTHSSLNAKKIPIGGNENGSSGFGSKRMAYFSDSRHFFINAATCSASLQKTMPGVLSSRSKSSSSSSVNGVGYLFARLKEEAFLAFSFLPSTKTWSFRFLTPPLQPPAHMSSASACSSSSSSLRSIVVVVVVVLLVVLFSSSKQNNSSSSINSRILCSASSLAAFASSAINFSHALKIWFAVCAEFFTVFKRLMAFCTLLTPNPTTSFGDFIPASSNARARVTSMQSPTQVSGKISSLPPTMSRSAARFTKSPKSCHRMYTHTDETVNPKRTDSSCNFFNV